MSDLHIDETLILDNMQAADADDVLRTMAANLYDHELVEESYIQAVIDREHEHPTGLPTKGPAVAIPHTSKEHVRQKTISIGVLDEPVAFGIMGEEKETVPVELVFMLAMDDEHSQLSMLQQLMSIFQDETQLSFYKNTKDKTKRKEALIDTLSLSRQGGETR
ncbi:MULTISPECIES: PTS sugar transporter subunit IIA [Salibacterium]|uniref:PTS system, galactitol-specific IIA component n=2 Tax=Salibacterium TaxID=1884429 RepID=A0A1I4PJ94_9BACI|nr:PTS sugar transporter subunit IIA [Salibacterium qingdaonense]SFM27777.1 PTS system, galactitol-specific IIA component [Salibacterium qingdaonense]